MTNHNSIQNAPAVGVNLSNQTLLNTLQNENISCSEQVNKSNQIFQEVLYLTRLMSGYHEFVHNCFLSHPDLENLTLSAEAIQLDIDKRLKSILQMTSDS